MDRLSAPPPPPSSAAPPPAPPPPPPAAAPAPPPPPPAAETDASAPSPILPYVVAILSVAVLVAVAVLIIAQPRRPRMVVEDVIVLDGPASNAPAATAAATPAPAPTAPEVAPATTATPPAPTAAPSAPEEAAPAAAIAPEPAPGDILEALLTDEGSSGDGSVKLGGLTVYVRGGRKGETTRFRILEVKTSRKGNRYATAELVPADAPAGEVRP